MKKIPEFKADKSDFPACIIKRKSGDMTFVSLVDQVESIGYYFDSYVQITENLYRTSFSRYEEDQHQYIHVDKHGISYSAHFSSEEEYKSDVKILVSSEINSKSFFNSKMGWNSNCFVSYEKHEDFYVLTDEDGEKELFSMNQWRSTNVPGNVEQEFSFERDKNDHNLFHCMLGKREIKFDLKSFTFHR